MDNDLINSQGRGPIERATADDRLATFNTNANGIYNKFSPFTNGGIGPSQPFIYTKISDSTFNKNLTRYDTYAAPLGSTVRDIKRIAEFSVTGTGILYLGKQLILQNQNAFNETRIYNPLSLFKAVAKPGSLGAIDYPQRHLETSGGLLNFFKDALLSTVGFQTKDSEKLGISGAAKGPNNDGMAYSAYAGFHGGARAGLLRYDTATKASAKFSEAWVTNPSQSGTNGGFLANLASGLINSLKKMIPSTNPLGAFGGKGGEEWVYRPEYQKGKDGAYYAFLSDSAGFLTVNARASQLFYNDRVFTSAIAASKSTVLIASDYHKYYPQKQQDATSAVLYATGPKIAEDSIGVKDVDGNLNNLKNLHERMVKAINGSGYDTPNQFKKSAERYAQVVDATKATYPPYTQITNPQNKFYSKMGAIASIERENMFAKSAGIKNNDVGSYEVEKDSEDRYNSLGILKGNRGEEPRDLVQGSFDAALKAQSADIIFFYFYDLINEVYIPFRATIKGLSDSHTADWEEVSYIGRADKLFLYKGFSRDVNFNFTVYANSAKEMIPMWERANYLVGLTRPSKYTSAGQQGISKEDLEFNAYLNEEAGTSFQTQNATGREGRFMYPPMTTFRLGDMYVDQPCIISSVSINVSDDANWESLRADDYAYQASSEKKIVIKEAKVRQLPLQFDVSMNLKILEKALSLGSNAHFGKTTYDDAGKETKRWIL